MSRVLVFGGDGILGTHIYLALKDTHELGMTLHGSGQELPPKLFSGAYTVCSVAAEDREKVASAIDLFRPDWVVNAVGLVKRERSIDSLDSLEANTVFPHLLARLCAERSTRLMHFSTDCVFSGLKGGYVESDTPDCRDWHGQCKALGEPEAEHVLVLRTSFIGLELACKKSLVEWFLSRSGTVRGYRKAIWSGFSAIEIGRIVGMLVQRSDPLSGLWHVASPAISKYELLSLLNSRLGDRGVMLVPDDDFVCDRSLDGSAFAKRTGYAPPSWDTMLDELAEDIRDRWVPEKPSYWHF